MLTSRNPASALPGRIAAELSAAFDPLRPVAYRAAYQPVDVIGGFSDYAGAAVLSAASDGACCAVATQPRDDGQVQVFSFDRFDEHRPFTFVAPMDAIARSSPDQLRAHFADPQTAWAAHAIGCLKRLPDIAGPLASAGLNIATMANTSDPITLAAAAMRAILPADIALRGERLIAIANACRRVLSEIIGQPAELRHVVAALTASPEHLVRIRCQPLDVLDPLPLPAGVRIGFRPATPDAAGQSKAIERLRIASEMGRMLILDKMRQLGHAAGREMIADPIGGYLANLDLNDYRRFFRPFLPETTKGGAFLLHYGRLADRSLHVEPDHHYAVQTAADFHVFGANRTRTFIEALQLAPAGDRTKELNKAGHLLYAAHKSLGADAGVDTGDADAIVDWVRANEHQGFYGAGFARPDRVAILGDASAVTGQTPGKA